MAEASSSGKHTAGLMAVEHARKVLATIMVRDGLDVQAKEVLTGAWDHSGYIEAMVRFASEHASVIAADLLEALEDLFVNRESGVQVIFGGNPLACDALEAKCRAAIARALSTALGEDR